MPVKAKPARKQAVEKQPTPTGKGEVVLDYVLQHLESPKGRAAFPGAMATLLQPSNPDALCADLKARAEIGKVKYGTYLRTNNGRSAATDLYQELCDGVMYSAQAAMEGDPIAAQFFPVLVNMASTLGAKLARK